MLTGFIVVITLSVRMAARGGREMLRRQ